MLVSLILYVSCWLYLPIVLDARIARDPDLARTSSAIAHGSPDYIGRSERVALRSADYVCMQNGDS